MPGPVVRIDLRKIDELIARKGVNMYHYRVAACPNRDDNGYHEPRCAACNDTGFLARGEQLMRALLTAHDPKKNPLPPGVVETGLRQLTPPRHIRLSDGDWIRMAQYPVRASEVLTFGAAQGHVLEALFPARVLSVAVVRLGAVVELPAAEWTDPAAGATVTAAGQLAWQPGATIQPGERYTVEYMHYEAYQVWRGAMPMQRGAEDKRLPDRALVRQLTRKLLRPQATPTAPDPYYG